MKDTKTDDTKLVRRELDGSEGDFMDLTEAEQWIKNFQEANPGHIKAHFYGKKILKKILKQKGCKGIWFFYGQDNGPTPNPKLVMFGSDKDAKLIKKRRKKKLLVESNGTSMARMSSGPGDPGGGSGAANNSLTCPNYCPDGD